VHHTAAWLGRVGDEGNAALTRPDGLFALLAQADARSGERFIHSGVLSRPGLSVAIAAATSEDLAAVSVTMQPALTSLSRWAE
jgi:hypothetical protein